MKPLTKEDVMQAQQARADLEARRQLRAQEAAAKLAAKGESKEKLDSDTEKSGSGIPSSKYAEKPALQAWGLNKGKDGKALSEKEKSIAPKDTIASKFSEPFKPAFSPIAKPVVAPNTVAAPPSSLTVAAPKTETKSTPESESPSEGLADAPQSVVEMAPPTTEAGNPPLQGSGDAPTENKSGADGKSAIAKDLKVPSKENGVSVGKSKGPLQGMEKGAEKPVVPRFSPASLDGGSEGGLLRSVTSQKGMNIVRALEVSSKQFTVARSSERKTNQGWLPVIAPPTGLQGVRGNPKPVWGGHTGANGKTINPKGGKGTIPKSKPTTHMVPETKNFWQRYMDNAAWSPSSKSTQKTPTQVAQTRAVDQLHGFVHSNATPDVDTHVDVDGKVPLIGQSDPLVARQDAAEARQQTSAELQRHQQTTRQDFGEAQIFPVLVPGTMHSQTPLSPGAEYAYGNAPLHDIQAEHAGILDMDAEAMLRGEADKCTNESLAAERAFEGERGEAIAQGQGQIAEEETATAGRQLKAKGKNAQNIAGLRADWQEENEGVMSKFDAQTEAERLAMEADIDGLCSDTEGEVSVEVSAAEKQAAEQKKKAEERVAKKREEAKKKESEKSWFDVAIDAVKSFFAELTAFVTQVFEDLRTWVKQKFEQLKQWVVEKIEQARKAIVGMIQWFGQKLKGFVDFALQAFPKLRDKFKAKIDQAMDATISFVNEQAERLKVFAQKTLDAIAARVDAALQVMETLTVGLFKILEFMTVMAIQMAEYFYNLLLDKILKVATLVAFVALIASGFLLGFMWDLIGEKTKEYLIDLLFDTGIWVFENAPDDFGFGVIWPMFVHGMLGFLYEANETPMEQKKLIMQKVSNILTGKDGDFLWNFVVNIFVGIWDNIKGIFEGIWMLIKFICYDMWVLMADFVDWIKKVAPDMADMIVGLVGDVKTFVADFKKEGPDKMESILSSKNIQKVMDFLNGLGDSVRVQAEVMGARAASGFRDLMLSDKAGAVIGEKLGWLYGNILVEVVLAVFTVGIGTAIKGGLKAAEWLGKFASWFQKFGKIGRGIARVADFFGKGLRWLVQTVEKFAAKLMELGDKLMAKFKQIFANLEKKIDDIVARMKGRVDDVPGQADDVLEHADDLPGGKVKMDEDGVVDTKHVDPEDAKHRKATGDRDADYLFAVAEAKALIALNEKSGTPAPIAARMVKAALQSKYKWVHDVKAKVDGPDKFDFYLNASPDIEIYPDYRSQLLDMLEARIDQINSARTLDKNQMNALESRLRHSYADELHPADINSIAADLKKMLTNEYRTTSGRDINTTVLESLDGKFSIRITHNQVGPSPIGTPTCPRIHISQGSAKNHGSHVCLLPGTSLGDIIAALT